MRTLAIARPVMKPLIQSGSMMLTTARTATTTGLTRSGRAEMCQVDSISDSYSYSYLEEDCDEAADVDNDYDDEEHV